MIDFGNFYQLIAKNHLSHWLETLPAQIAAGSAISTVFLNNGQTPSSFCPS